jgi:hypothetical protein
MVNIIMTCPGILASNEILIKLKVVPIQYPRIPNNIDLRHPMQCSVGVMMKSCSVVNDRKL